MESGFGSTAVRYATTPRPRTSPENEFTHRPVLELSVVEDAQGRVEVIPSERGVVNEQLTPDLMELEEFLKHLGHHITGDPPSFHSSQENANLRCRVESLRHQRELTHERLSQFWLWPPDQVLLVVAKQPEILSLRTLAEELGKCLEFLQGVHAVQETDKRSPYLLLGNQFEKRLSALVGKLVCHDLPSRTLKHPLCRVGFDYAFISLKVKLCGGRDSNLTDSVQVV